MFLMWMQNAGDLLHKLELECRWKHIVQWLHRWSHQGLGYWSLLERRLESISYKLFFILLFFDRLFCVGV